MSTSKSNKVISHESSVPPSYMTVVQDCSAEIVVKKSRFISHIRHVESDAEARAFIDEIKCEHTQAKHNVYAYLLKCGTTRYSDDGEPAQTSGLPTFNTLVSANLADVAIVTTRYFGGTLLGTGGLVRAYTDASNEVIKKSEIVEMTSCVDITLKAPYDLHSAILKVAQELPAKIISCDYSDLISIELRVRAELAECAKHKLTDAVRGKIPIEVSDPKFNAL